MFSSRWENFSILSKDYWEFIRYKTVTRDQMLDTKGNRIMSNATLKTGQLVQAKPEGWDDYYMGTVVNMDIVSNRSETFEIKFEKGMLERKNL